MKSIAVIGSGQAGLVAAHAFLRAGHDVELFSERTAQQWLDEGRPTGTAVRFRTSLAFEQELGLDQGHADAPKMEALRVTICSHPAKPFLTLTGRFPVSPLAIDVRYQSAQWMRAFEQRGGKLVIEKVSPERIEEIARNKHLTIVATGKEGGQLFARDAERSPATSPKRHLAMVNCEGPPMLFSDLPLRAAKFTIFEGLGECYWTPYYHKSERPLWNLVFEAIPGTPYDRFQSARSGEEVLTLSKDIIRRMMPWDASWIEGAKLADPNSWLVGAITPTVRKPVRAPITHGGPIVPLGDAYMSFDPLGAQGANMGNRLAQVLVQAVVERGDEPLDAAWVERTYDAFYERWGGPAMRWTHLLLGPMAPATRYMMLAQMGADGAQPGGTPKQRLADAFAQNFDDPRGLVETFSGFSKTRSWVSQTMGHSADWEAIKGLAAVARRQIGNQLSKTVSPAS